MLLNVLKRKDKAERLPWRLAENNPSVKLVIINQGYVVGPALIGQPPRSSNAHLFALANGSLGEKGLPASSTGLVQMEDVLEA